MVTYKYHVKNKSQAMKWACVVHILFFIPCKLFVLRNKYNFFSQEWSWKKFSCLWRSAHGPFWKLSIMCTTNIWENSGDKGIIQLSPRIVDFAHSRKLWAVNPSLVAFLLEILNCCVHCCSRDLYQAKKPGCSNFWTLRPFPTENSCMNSAIYIQ